MATVLFDNGEGHRVIAFHDLVRGDDGIHANQYLIEHGGRGALIDPGGALLYTPLSLAIAPFLRLNAIDWILASHQDPDVIGSVDRWLMYTSARVATSRLWGRFIPHSVPHYQQNTGYDRYYLFEDRGGSVELAGSPIRAIPAHFLHSVGNFHFYDPISRILFSGDVGASNVEQSFGAVADFDGHAATMLGFHRRYMASNSAIRAWLARVRQLDVRLIAPQHGNFFEGPLVNRFYEWIAGVRCGVDLLDAVEVFA